MTVIGRDARGCYASARSAGAVDGDEVRAEAGACRRIVGRPAWSAEDTM
ncbi:hypothetical protein [Brevibacillus borstelensis]|nr:hypothetical protein [Brevibacillus borstelensis]WNF08587.1 hypothetical protein RFB14_08500 [Brevibacillus borstelensis]